MPLTPFASAACRRPIFALSRWFNLSFAHFGRTSTEKQTEITQDIYLHVRNNNLLLQKSEEMTYCTGCERSVSL